MSNVFNSKRGVRGLAVLVFSFILLSFLGFYVVHYYNRSNRNNISWSQAKREVLSWAVMAKRLHPRQLRTLIAQENHTWLRLKVEQTPLDNATVIDANNIWQVQQALQQQQQRIYLAIQLPRRGYLNIHGHKPERTWLFYGMLGSVAILLLFLFLLCYWVIQYISTPLAPLKKAVQRLAYDIKAPAIEETGAAEMRAVIRAFNDMQLNIRRLLDDRTQMLAAISHDLRTPITRLKLRAEMIDDENLQQKIVADLNDMEQMIASILAFAREQNADENRQTFDLAMLVESICNDMADAGKDVHYDSEMNKLPFFGRMLSLKRAFSNVLENALKYAGACQVSLNAQADKVMITFVDAGPGIPEDKVDKVFTPFYRVDSARSPTLPGAGLGLSVVKEIIAAHGGSISLRNLEKGLQVLIELPMEKDVSF